MDYILSLLIFLPLIGIVFTFNVKSWDIRTAKNSHNIRFIVTLTEALICLVLLFFFDKHNHGTQFAGTFMWLEGLHYRLGIDGVSILFISAVALLFLISVIMEGSGKIKLPKEYSALLLWTESMVLGLLCSDNMLTFSFFFMALLLPLTLLVKMWGASAIQNKESSANNMFFATSAISAGLVLFTLAFLSEAKDIPLALFTTTATDTFISLGLLVPFLMTGYIIPLLVASNNTNLNTPNSTLFACCTVPFIAGFYGIVKIALPIMNPALISTVPFLTGLFAAGFIFFAIKAFTQKDLRKIVGCYVGTYLSLCFIGLFLGTPAATDGAILFGLNYIPVLAALIICTAVIYDAAGTTHIFNISGLIHYMPLFADLFFITAAAAISFPLSGGFSGLFLMTFGAFPVAFYISLFMVLANVVVAVYIIYTYQNLIFGTPPDKIKDIKDISAFKSFMLLFCLAFSFGIGLFPDWFLQFIS